MTGSPVVAAWLAHVTFWALLVIGLEELGSRRFAALAAAWLVGYLVLPHLPYGSLMFAPLVAVVDIGLVFMIFKGDVRIH